MPKDLIQIRRGTKAELLSLTSGNYPAIGEPIFLTDVGEESIAFGKGATTPPVIISSGSDDPQNYVEVRANLSPAENGRALLEAYASAKTLTPNGSALSLTNRATLFVYPGEYVLDNTLILDSKYVDIRGVSENASACKITSALSKTVWQQVGGMHITNIYFENSSGTLLSAGSAFHQEDVIVDYYPFDFFNVETLLFQNEIATFKNCIFSKDITDSCRMTIDVSDFSNGCVGHFTDCVGGFGSFGGAVEAAAQGRVGGYFYNCKGGKYSFGNGGSANEGAALLIKAYDCEGAFCIGGSMTSSDVMNCKSQYTGAFAGNGGLISFISNSKFRNCSASGVNAFGALASDIQNCTFIDCEAYGNSFSAGVVALSGVSFYNCSVLGATVNDKSFGGGSVSATSVRMINCLSRGSSTSTQFLHGATVEPAVDYSLIMNCMITNHATPSFTAQAGYANLRVLNCVNGNGTVANSP